MHNLTQSSLTIRFKRSVTAIICLIGLATTLDLATAAPNQPINPPCTPFGGMFVFTVFQFDSATTAHAEGEIWVEGELAGHFSAQYFNIDQKGNGVSQLNGQHTQTFLDGSTLVTHDEILLQSDNQDPARVQANSRLYVVSGTGAYAGASGVLHTHGKLNVVTLEGGIDFTGQVCVP